MTSKSSSLYITQIRFCRALAVVRFLPIESGGMFQPSTAEKLKFYGLYKQAVVGDCMLLKPSSRNVVQYAKWKSWDKLRGVCPIDAQIMYIQALIDLLKEFLSRYPNSLLAEKLHESVHYLEETEDTYSHGLQEVQWNTNNLENQEFCLGQIEQDQLLPENHLFSYYYSTPTEFPITPELSPKCQRKKSVSSSISSLQQPYNYVLDEPNSLKITANNSSLYQTDYNKTKKPSKKSSRNNKAIQTLQLEVAALCEEVDRVRRTVSKSKYTFKWLFKSIAKHAFFNFLIFMMLFIVLWRRKSPIACAVINYAGPRLKELYGLFISLKPI